MGIHYMCVDMRIRMYMLDIGCKDIKFREDYHPVTPSHIRSLKHDSQ